MIIPEAIYTTAQIVKILGISPSTLRKWIKQGLRFVQPGTKTQYFLGRHIIEFMFGGKP